MSIRHTEMINSIIAARGYQSYLEIGLGNGRNFQNINVKHKTGVDPKLPSRNLSSGQWLRASSDGFFEGNDQIYDFIFVDGLHHYDQALRDILNSLQILSPEGTIMVHDCNPPSQEAQQVPRTTRLWTGDVWKAWVELRSDPTIHQLCTYEDYGCGILEPGYQKPLKVDYPLTYQRLNENREEWLNLIDWEDYENNYLHREPGEVRRVQGL